MKTYLTPDLVRPSLVRPGLVRPGLVAVLAVCVFPFVFHWPTLSQLGRTLPWDFIGFHFPLLSVMQEAWLAGNFPFWDSYNYCGRPFAANPQTAVFYPAQWLAVVWAGSCERLLANFEIAVVAHVALGGLFALLLARRLGCRWTSSALAGIAFAGGCFFASQVQHVGAVEGGAWLPAVWWAVAGLVQAPQTRRFVCLAVLLAVAFLTGFTPGVLVIYASSVLFCFLLIRAWRAPARPIAFCLGGAILLSLALAGVQLLPTLELAAHSIGKYRLDWRGTGGGMPWEAFVSLIAPHYYGISDLSGFRLPYEITSCFLFGGAISLALVLYGVFWSFRDRLLRWLCVLVVVASVLMLGDRTWVGLLVWHGLPSLLRASYYPHYWLMMFSLAFALAAALALDKLRAPTPVKALLALLTAVELLWLSSGLPMNSMAYEPAQWAPGTLSAGSGRFDVTDESDHWVINAALLRTPSANGYDPLALERLIQARLFFAKGQRWGALYKVERPDSPMLEAMNVDTLLAHKPITAGDWHKGDAAPPPVYRRLRPSSRAWFVSSVGYADSMQEAIRMLQAPGWRPRDYAVVEAPAGNTSSNTGDVQVVSWQAGEIRLKTINPKPGFLVVSEAYYPGWTAIIDGRETPVLPADVAFQGLWIAGGTHTVVFKYAPRSFIAGFLLSLLGIIAALLPVLPWIRRRWPWRKSG